MIIAIDISPLTTGHKVRGTGFYLHYLKESLEKHFPQYTYIFFTQGEKLPNNTNIVHYPYFDTFLVTLPILKKKRTIVTVHDLTPIIFSEHFPAGIKGQLKWHIQKNLLKNVDAIITDSNNSKNDIVRLIGFPKEKVHVVYLAAGNEFKEFQISNFPVATGSSVSHDKFQILKKKYNLPEKFALYVGDVTWNKNLPRLLRAVQKINIPLVMVGKALVNRTYDRSNPWNKDLVEVQKLTPHNKNIITLGFIPTEDLVYLYNAATVFAMPSLYEGFGLPILEAMSCGCPVITTKEGSLPEVAGDAAYYVDGYNIESIAYGIQKVFSNNKLQKELSKKGLERAKKFSWEKTAKQTVEVYEKVNKLPRHPGICRLTESPGSQS